MLKPERDTMIFGEKKSYSLAMLDKKIDTTHIDMQVMTLQLGDG